MSIYKEAIEKWGVIPQATQTMEECAELIVALNKYFIRGQISSGKLAEEVVDVEIMCRQIRHIIGNDIVELKIAKKLDRLRQRLRE